MGLEIPQLPRSFANASNWDRCVPGTHAVVKGLRIPGDPSAAGENFEGFEDEIRWKHAKNSKFHLHFDQESIFGALDPQDIIINSIDQP